MAANHDYQHGFLPNNDMIGRNQDGGGLGVGGMFGGGGGGLGMNPGQHDYIEPEFNDQPLEFTGSLLNKPRTMEGSNRNDEDGDNPNDVSGNLLSSMPQGSLMSNDPWVLDPGLPNFPIGGEFLPAMGQYQMDGGFPGGNGPSQQRILNGTNFTLTSPPPGHIPTHPRREKPVGCCTIYVGGLPHLCTNEMLQEIFENFGEIHKLLRVARRPYCHIRYKEEDSVDKAFEVLGYMMRVDNNGDPDHSGILFIDYAESRIDKVEYQKRQEDEEHRRQQEALTARREEEILSRHSNTEAARLTEKLKEDDTFQSAISVVISWLDRGDCKKHTANSFFTLLRSAFSQTRRLSTEKQRLDDQIKAMTEMASKQTGVIYCQASLIHQMLIRATKQPSRDHFSKAQRRHIDGWKKVVQDLCTDIQGDLGLTDKGEADMDVSDEEDAVRERQVAIVTTGEGDTKKMRLDLEYVQDDFTTPQMMPLAEPSEEPEAKREDSSLDRTVPTPAPVPTSTPISKDEADALRCQLEAYRNEVDILKNERVQYEEEKETQVKALQHALLGMQQQLMEAKNKLKKEEDSAGKKLEKLDSPLELKEPGCKESGVAVEFNELMQNDALLVGVMSTFLHVHPFGASVEYLWSYLQRLNLNATPTQIEALLVKFPRIFQQELFGVGATLEKRWQYIGFATSLGQSLDKPKSSDIYASKIN